MQVINWAKEEGVKADLVLCLTDSHTEVEDREEVLRTVHLDTGTQWHTFQLFTCTVVQLYTCTVIQFHLCTLHSAQFTCTLGYPNIHHSSLTSNCTFKTLHSTLHTVQCTLHSPHYTTLHTAHSTLHTQHCTLNTAHLIIHTWYFTLDTSHLTLHTCHPCS